MAKIGLAVLEEALRARKLDRTLATALQPFAPSHPNGALTEIAEIDALLQGGLPRGQLSEIAGSRSSGRTAVLLHVLAAATRRGEIAALVDPFDCLDVASLVSAGVDLDRLLWVRGHALALGRTQGVPLANRVVERGLKALNLVLQAGGFGVVAIDFAEAPLAALNGIPFTTWLRVQRTVEGSETACVFIAPQPLARSAGGFTLSLGARVRWTGSADCSRRLAGMDVAVRVISPRRRMNGQTSHLRTQAPEHSS